jgi:DNA repair protein RecO (recombination protein O)
MAAEKATALVLRVIDFSETSVICTLFTREFGRISALAKGARRPKGPFESALDLLSLCRVVFLRKTSGALDLLTEAKLERRFRPAAGNLENLYAGYYIAELLGEFGEDYDPLPELFDAANAALLALRDAGEAARQVPRFEWQLLRVLGHLPAFDHCAECGTSLIGAKNLTASGRIRFALLDGGAVCESCREGKKQVVSISIPAIQMMQSFADTDTETWRTMPLERATYGEMRGVLNNYFSHLLGRPTKMQKLLGLPANRTENPSISKST